MNKITFKKIKSRGVFFFLLSLLISLNSYAQTPKFTTPTLVSGTDKAIGAQYRYSDVTIVDGTNVDAIVRIVNIDSATLITVDNPSNGGLIDRFQPEISTLRSNGYVEFLIEFYKSGTYGTAQQLQINVSSFTLEAIDIDGNEFFDVVIPSNSSYVLENPTNINVISPSSSNLYTRFQGPSGSINTISLLETKYIAAVNFGSLNSVTFRLGNSASSSQNRQSSISFGEVTFIVPKAPIANDDFALCKPEGLVTIDVSSNDFDANQNIDKATVDLNPPLAGRQTTYNVAGQGDWNVNLNGIFTFTPLSTFKGNPTPINYSIKDLTGLVSNNAKITITYAPSQPVSNGNITQCQTNPIQTLNANAAFTSNIGITWYDASTNGNPIGNPTLNTIGTKTFYAQYSNGTCSSLTRTAVTLTIVALPVANAGTDFTKICTSIDSGKQIGVAAVTGVTYSWLPATGLSSATVANPTANPDVTTTYTLTATDTASGCTATGTITVTVDQSLPVINAGADFTKTCTSNNNGKQIGAAAVTGVTYSWLPATGLSSATVANPTANPDVTTTYTLTATNTASGCTATSTITVTVDKSVPAANAGTYFTKTCNSNINGEQIGAAAVTGVTYSWLPATGLSSATVANPTANPDVTTTYTLTATNTASGCTATSTITVTVDKSIPVANTGTDFTKTCTTNASGKQIGAAAVTGVTYSWLPATGLSSATVANPTANPDVTTTYTLTATNTASGCTATSTITVTVDKSIPAANAGTDFTKTCNSNINGEQIGAAAVTGVTYSWLPATGLSNTTIANPTANPDVTTTYTLTATNTASGCSATSTITVTVSNSNPTATIITSKNVSCFGGNDGTASATATGGVPNYTYSWNTVPVQKTAIVSNLKAGEYTVTVTDKNGCTDIETVTISEPKTILSATAVSINNNNCVDCNIGAINLTPKGGTAPYTFIWSNGATTEDISSLSKGKYDVEIKDVNGCSAIYSYIINESGIKILKDANYVDSNNDGKTNIGDNVIYNFTVTNIGNETLTNVNITDNKATINGGPLAFLIAGSSDSTTFSGIHAITQEDINKGIYYNLATVNGKDSENFIVNDTSTDPTPCISCPKDPQCVDCTSTPLTQKPSIALVKTASVGGTGIVGDVITYTFTVTNTGNTSLSNVIVTDPMVGLTISGNRIATLAVGASSAVIKGTYTITQADIDAGKVVNTALATAKDPKGNDVTDISGTTVNNDTPTDTPLTQKPSIALVKTASVGGTGIVGDVITYTFTVTNTGNTSLSNVIVTDPMVGLTISGNPIATLAVGASSAVIKGTYTITQADIDAGKVVNTALATAKDPKGNDVTDISGTTVNNDTPTDTPLTQKPSIALVKTASVGGTGIVGDVITYTFTVTNTGNTSLSNVVVTDPMVGLTISGNPIATLAVGASSAVIKGTYTITQADIDAGKVVNTALATAKDPKGNDVTDISGTTINNDTPTDTPLTQKPSIALVKTASVGGTGIVGDVITYTFTVTNTGNTSLSNVVVTDPMVGLTISGNPIATLAVGASSAVIKGTYTITQADIDAGKVVNTALATAKDPKGNDVTDISGTTVNNDTSTDKPLTQKPDINITKDGFYVDNNTDGITNVGDKIIYNFTITNTGNVILTNVIVTDPLPGLVITGNPIILNIGASNSTAFVGTYSIIQADIDRGVVYNLATVIGTTSYGTTVTDTSSDPTPCNNCTPKPDCIDCTITVLLQNPKLEVVKTTSTDNYSLVGDVINYNISVKNTGNVTLYQILVTDPLTGLSTTISSLVPGSSEKFTESYTITPNDLINNSVINTANANGLSPNNTAISGSDTVEVDKSIVLGCGTILVHNAFSPNGDGINEVFVIDNIDDAACYPENTVEIYNRWGVLVFETKNYNNQTNNFDGISRGRTTVNQSSGLPTGTYFYILNYSSIDGNGKVEIKKLDGYLYLTK